MGIILTSTGLPLLTAAGLAARAAPAGSGGVVPLPPPKPAPGAATLQSGTKILHRGVTFTFYAQPTGTQEAAVHWHVSANGDPVLITDAAHLPSSVWMEMDPPSQQDSAGYWMHGAEMDPVHQPTHIQGFDEGLKEGGGAKDGQMRYWDGDALNVDPGYTGSRIPVSTGDAFCLVKALRDPSKIPYNPGSSDHYKLVYRYVTLAAIDSPPPGAGTWFRPGISAPVKTWPITPFEQIDFTTENSVFRHLPRPSGLIQPSTAVAEILDSDGGEITAPFWNVFGERGRRMYLSRAAGTYADHLGSRRGEYCCAMHTDNRGNPTEQAAREELAKLLIQWGIDNDGAHQSGQLHANGAGQHYGYLPMHYLAAFALGDPDMLARAQVHLANFVGQCFWVRQHHIGMSVIEVGHDYRMQETYHIEHLGIPEWVSEPGWQQININDLIEHPGDDGMCSSLYLGYRGVNFGSQIFETFGVGLLRNGFGTGLTGDAAMRRGGAANDPNHLGGAGLAYTDRQYNNPNNLGSWRPWREGGSKGPAEPGSTEVRMYNAWRNAIPAPRWTGVPDVTSHHTDLMKVFWPGAASGEIDWDIAGRAYNATWAEWEYSTLPVLERQVSYSLDGVWWSDPISAGTAKQLTLIGLRPQTLHWLRWRQRNSAGWSIWSPSWQQNTNALEFPRNRMRSGGTLTGTAFANAIAPKIMYKPYPEFGPEPFFEPVSDLATDPVYGPKNPSTTKLYCGIGYWTGGSASNFKSGASDPDRDGDLLSATTYQWQRSTNGGGSWSNVGLNQNSYDISGESRGTQIRCVVTVRGVQAISNAVTIP